MADPMVMIITTVAMVLLRHTEVAQAHTDQAMETLLMVAIPTLVEVLMAVMVMMLLVLLVARRLMLLLSNGMVLEVWSRRIWPTSLFSSPVPTLVSTSTSMTKSQSNSKAMALLPPFLPSQSPSCTTCLWPTFFFRATKNPLLSKSTRSPSSLADAILWLLLKLVPFFLSIFPFNPSIFYFFQFLFSTFL